MNRLRSALHLACLVLLLLFVSACVPGRIAVKPQTVEVTRYVREEIPSGLTYPISIYEPEPLCVDPITKVKVLCNGQLANLLIDYRNAVNSCNIDRNAVMMSQPKNPGKSKTTTLGDPEGP